MHCEALFCYAKEFGGNCLVHWRRFRALAYKCVN
uniref:Uncharacterized protein n=1 Tax=Rhizophora mucronata TaxID=61149 RepID=A0A2P2Q0T2_RHIMU